MARSLYMICEVCGQETSGASARCSACGASLAAPHSPYQDTETVLGLDPNYQSTIASFTRHGSDDAVGLGARTARAAGISNDRPSAADALTLGPDTPTTKTGATGGQTGVIGPLPLGKNFGRYHIIRMLGIGGMGAVYQAWDEELGVAVALKVIRPETMKDPRAAAEVERRFKRELLLARQVTHRNVVRIHDIGEIDGIKYITMAYVKGTDLATRLKREARLPVAVVLPIVRSIVSGLTAAHHAGVVHRDLKPANIIISDEGEALIMDFGIARSSSGRVTPPGQDLRRPTTTIGPITRVFEATMVGAIVGTVEYMAPEQAKGLPVDHRADIYSLGLIMYDALVGGYRSISAESAVAELHGRMAKAPPPVRTVLPEVPEALERVISKCLEPDADKRYQTSEELAADLDRLDDRGELIPVKRVVGMKMVGGIVALALAVIGGVWYYARTVTPPPPHDPVSVVIADFQNRTGDSSLDHTLEPALRIALEEAGFITAFDRGQMSTLGVPPVTGLLDEAAARKIALGQGLGVVVSGALERDDRGYKLSAKAIQPVSGDTIASGESRVAEKAEVLAGVAGVAATLRKGLGDNTSESSKRFAMETLSTTSLDVIHEYAQAMEALSAGKNEEARRLASKAADLDPNFGAAFGVMAAASEALSQHDEAKKYIELAMSRLDKVTERERYRIRGLFFALTGDQQKCAEEYGALISRYAADAAAHNNLAICSKNLRNLSKAVEEMQRAVAILPKRARYQGNLALFAAYAGDFQTAERGARVALDLNATYSAALNALAFSQLGRDQLAEAAQTYESLSQVSPSMAASGEGQLAIYQGRYTAAADILQRAATADFTAKHPDVGTEKMLGVAYSELSRGNKTAAMNAAENAIFNSDSTKVTFLAARILAQAGETERARDLAASLGQQLFPEPQAYAKIVEGNILLNSGQTREAIDAFTAANRLLDTWIGRFDLGRAYLEAGAFAQADSEFDRCLTRRGEALALILDGDPTFGYLPPLYYYQGRVREGLKLAGAANSYRTYLSIRGAAGEDPLLADVRKRLGQ
jgi:tetratricopeptide (TPR) repeat protein/tRNA A-37 threonylcarbamoyl transferase component Bud32